MAETVHRSAGPDLQGFYVLTVRTRDEEARDAVVTGSRRVPLPGHDDPKVDGGGL